MAHPRLHPHRKTVLDLIGEGYSDGAIGDRFGVCAESVRYFRKQNGITRHMAPTKRRDPQETPRTMSAERIEQEWRRLLAGRRFD